jgi:hypothetical protein
LEEGIIGDLVLPSYAVLDPKARKLFSEERKIPLFKKKTVLYVQLRPATAGDTKPFDAHLLRPYPKGARFYVELHQEPPAGGKPVIARLHEYSTRRFISPQPNKLRMPQVTIRTRSVRPTPV